MDSGVVGLIFRSTMKTFEVKNNYHMNGGLQPIYVEGSIFVVTMDITTPEYVFVQTFPLLFANFFWVLFYVVEVFEGLPHR